MKHAYTTIIFFTIFLQFTGNVSAEYTPADSIETRKINNQTYIIHEVEQGETLFGLSRKYRVELNDILNANPGVDKTLRIGQEIRIPKDLKTITEKSEGKIEHNVKSGETLFSIARKYNVSISNIKQWNKMNSDILSIGDKLIIFTDAKMAAEMNEFKSIKENNGKKVHIVNLGETLYSISRKYNISPDDIKDWNRLENNNIFVGQELVIGYTDNKDEKVVIASELKVEESKKEEIQVKKKEVEEGKIVTIDDGEYEKVSEKGIARVIEGSEETKKYLALHRTAPIGTIMQVKNEMNDLSVFVRVIGKLPETGDNDNILLKISKTAYDRLGAYDNQFPVEITYHP